MKALECQWSCRQYFGRPSAPMWSTSCTPTSGRTSGSHMQSPAKQVLFLMLIDFLSILNQWWPLLLVRVYDRFVRVWSYLKALIESCLPSKLVLTKLTKLKSYNFRTSDKRRVLGNRSSRSPHPSSSRRGYTPIWSGCFRQYVPRRTHVRTHSGLEKMASQGQ